MLGTALVGFTAAWCLWSLLSLLNNYRVARRIGLPIVLEPVSALNLPWLISNQVFKRLPYSSKIRDPLIRRWLRFSYIGWQFDQGYDVHQQIGPAFVLVSPGQLSLVVADPDAAHDILSRRKDFVKPAILYDGLNVFGPNLDTVEGQTWQRHRRLTAPSLNENVSSSVWRESIQQAEQAVQSWKAPGMEVSSTARDTATVTLNVLTACGFGVRSKFQEDTPSSYESNSMSYRVAVVTILTNFAFLLALPMKHLNQPFMPRTLQRLGIACKEFKRHVSTMMTSERAAVGPASDRQNTTLLTSLVLASDAEKSDNSSIGLTDEEILGNIFIFTFAGHETTANTVATTIFYLARYPRYQKWVREELRHVLRDYKNIAREYQTLFPKLKRCLATMLETLRVHGSIVFIPKSTTDQAQSFTLKGTTHVVPPNTFVHINNHALQVNPHTWGSDAHEWRPDRWIVHEQDSSIDLDTRLEREQLFQPSQGTFIPWADGPRVCPGKKFSQVEFVAIMATLLHNHAVSPVIRGTEEETHAKLDHMIRNSEIGIATLQMRDSTKVRLAWRTLSGII